MERDHLPVFVFNVEGLPAETRRPAPRRRARGHHPHRAPLRAPGPRGHRHRRDRRRGALLTGVFTTDEDVERAIAAVADIAAYGRKRNGAALSVTS
jgi:hypothetical protein